MLIRKPASFRSWLIFTALFAAVFFSLVTFAPVLALVMWMVWGAEFIGNALFILTAATASIVGIVGQEHYNRLVQSIDNCFGESCANCIDRLFMSSVRHGVISCYCTQSYPVFTGIAFFFHLGVSLRRG